MFCYHCGKELRDGSRFCCHCGAPAREEDTNHTAEGRDALRPHCGAPAREEDTNHTAEGRDSPGPHAPDTAADTVPGLILKGGKIILSGNTLALEGKHYFRKPGETEFRKKKEPSAIPLGSICGASEKHRKYGGRCLLALLLLVCSAAGALFSAHYSRVAYIAWNTPYRDQELAAQEEILSVIDGDGAGLLLQYQEGQRENRAEAETLSAELDGLREQRTQEILAAVYTSDRFDLDDFFNREPFSRAYREYLQELLDVFRADRHLDSWLYSYYKTAREYGGNTFLDTDMWIYADNKEGIFSPYLDNVDTLTEHQYDLDLYEHILCTGRIYITGADFMREILSLPRYTVDSAVFVMAYGGSPDTSAMSVPGWSRSHYEEFWLYGADYYDVDAPLWLDYGLTAKDFAIDWNTLVDETACYNAYLNFMDKTAPGLPRYDMASYYADDTAYGGMGCRLTGTEASVSDLIATYAEEHPEYIDELVESGKYGRELSSSVDEDIESAEARLGLLETELAELKKQEAALEQLLADADLHRNNYALLLEDIERHTRETARCLLSFGAAAILCTLSALAWLLRFISLLRRPRHLFLIRCGEAEYAFTTSRCTGRQLEELQGRLTGQEDEGSLTSILP